METNGFESNGAFRRVTAICGATRRKRLALNARLGLAAVDESRDKPEA
jgi:hypothetical protein